VDLWDLTKLLLRRWYIALPLLLASVAIVFMTAQTVTPDYRALGYLQMIPPPGSTQAPNANAKPRPHNPWLDLGYEPLGTAVLLKVTDKDSLERLAANGLTDSVAVELSRNGTLFEIEAVGTSPAQATATVQEVIRMLTAEIAASQQQYRVLPEDTITTTIVNNGGNVEVVTTKQKRILVVAAGLGVLFTTAATIGLDALLRRLRRRRPEADHVDPLMTSMPPARMPDVVHQPTMPPLRPSWRDNPPPPAAPSPGPLLSLAPGPGPDRPRVTYESIEPAVAPRPYSEAEERRRPGSYLTPRGDTAASEAPTDIHERGESADGDVTIVLPLAYLSKRDDRNSKN
jgi:hypothetical protein